MKKQCPLCRVIMEKSACYPEIVCLQCSLKVRDRENNLLSFYSECMNGGLKGFYTATGEPYSGTECYIDGIQCVAGEHSSGGVVVQVAVA